MAVGMNLTNLYQNEYSFEEKVNENFKKVDSFSTLSVKTKITSSKMEIENDKLYLIDANNDDFLSDKVGQIACYNANIGWFFYQPKEGSILFLQDEEKFYFYANNNWQEWQNSAIQTVDGVDIDLSKYLKKENNLSDLKSISIARNNLNVYSKDDVYSKSEIDDKISGVAVASDNGNVNVGGCLMKNNNLSDLTNTEEARDNLNVYAKSDTYNRSKNLLDVLDQDSACHNIGTLRDWEIRRVGDYKFSAMKTDHDNWLICDGREVDRTEYQQLFALIGTSFGAGDESTTFNLPDFRNKTMWGANDNLNSTLSSGLPNITGNMTPGCVSGLTYPLGVTSVSGCFSNSARTNVNFLNNASSSKTTAIQVVKFDASASNAIYGRSTIVQPPAICVNVFILAK